MSPATQGLVLSISPIFFKTLYSFILSMNIIPGSPFFHAISTISPNTSLASRYCATLPSWGFTRAYSSPASTALINPSVTATEILKFVMSVFLLLHLINSSISGWSTRRMPMLAPLRTPPCFTASVAALKTFIKLTGPEATPPVELTVAPAGRSLEKLKPVPPPLLCIMAACLIASNIPSIESSTGSTKHAESWPRSFPAFIRVGELGINSRLVSILKKVSSSSTTSTPVS